jgi:long-chain acyl-CoA synthetase
MHVNLEGEPFVTIYEDRPWQRLYEPSTRIDPVLEHPSLVAAFRDALKRSPETALITYFDRTFTVAEIDEKSDAFAVALSEQFGIDPGDRIAAFMQNMPQFVITALAAWKIGAVVVPLNPMLRDRELLHQLNDSGAVALVTLDSLYDSVAGPVLDATGVRVVVTTSGRDMQSRNDPRLLPEAPRYDLSNTWDFGALLIAHHHASPKCPELQPNDLALLTYTSGTTGIPKAAMNSHGNLLSNGQITRDWMHISPHTPILGIAPLFHITGLVCQIVTSLITPAPLILSYRFEPDVMLDSIREYSPAFAVGAVTAFVALISAKTFAKKDFSSFERIYSGGAPVSPAIAKKFEAETDRQMHGCFGMTETSAPTHFAPFNIPGRVDSVSGALTIGIPTPGTLARIVDDAGIDVPAGVPGELVIEGPQVTAGYWRRPDETEATIRGKKLYSGDIAVMDDEGWFYIVDRKKDVIISSGYKVWPREVEDVLNEHPLVLESAVIGVPDEYRGETVKAFVCLREGSSIEPQTLIDFAGERLSAYKRPHSLVIMQALPKTISGKILRRELR